MLSHKRGCEKNDQEQNQKSVRVEGSTDIREYIA